MYCLSNIHLSCSSAPSHRNGEFPPSQNIISFMTQHDCCIAAMRSVSLLLFSQGSKMWRQTQVCSTVALLLENFTEIKFRYHGINFQFFVKKQQKCGMSFFQTCCQSDHFEESLKASIKSPSPKFPLLLLYTRVFFPVILRLIIFNLASIFPSFSLIS